MEAMPGQPSCQRRAAPLETDVPAQAQMWDWIGASGARLLTYPARWKMPALCQVWSVDQLKVEAIVLRLFSGLGR